MVTLGLKMLFFCIAKLGFYNIFGLKDSLRKKDIGFLERLFHQSSLNKTIKKNTKLGTGQHN